MKPRKKLRKVTMVLPDDLLKGALESTGDSLASTVRQGLELLRARVAYEKLRALRGKVKFSLDLETLRSDE